MHILKKGMYIGGEQKSFIYNIKWNVIQFIKFTFFMKHGCNTMTVPLPFKEAPYSFQYMSVFKTKSYLNLKSYLKLIFCTSHCFLLYKRVILTHNRYSPCYHDNMTSPSIWPISTKKAVLAGK